MDFDFLLEFIFSREKILAPKIEKHGSRQIASIKI